LIGDFCGFFLWSLGHLKKEWNRGHMLFNGLSQYIVLRLKMELAVLLWVYKLLWVCLGLLHVEVGVYILN
jgi:hypothetical protein